MMIWRSTWPTTRLYCTLNFEIGISNGSHSAGITEKLGKALDREFSLLLSLCDDHSDTETQPSCFSDSSLTESQLLEIGRICHDVEDVYCLTPIQAGMFGNSANGNYHLQYLLRFDRSPDKERLIRSISLLAQRHPVLRSSFIKLSDGSVKQLIHKTQGPILRFSSEQVDSLMDADLDQPFDFSESLVRITCIGSCLLFSAHHIILDGWSLSVQLHKILGFR